MTEGEVGLDRGAQVLHGPVGLADRQRGDAEGVLHRAEGCRAQADDHGQAGEREQHGGTLRMSIHDVTRQLNAGLGPTLVAALTGTRDRKLPIR